MNPGAQDNNAEGRDKRAREFVNARLGAQAVFPYPGEKPASIDAAYAIQDDAIDIYPDTLTGWKVGGIGPDLRDKLGVNRLVGPVFSSYTFDNSDRVIEMPVFAGGFAAIEGEVIAVIGEDVPDGQVNFTPEDAMRLTASMHTGVEIASSPFPEINDHGPLVTISDFGNNRGLILGDEIESWRDMKLDDWQFRTLINGREVGAAVPGGMPGGPIESVRYALENTAKRGRPLKAGMKILTGAVTGVHQAYTGDESKVLFRGGHAIRCKLVPLRARTPAA